MNWLDTETREILQKEREPKLALPKAAEFGLILLQKGSDQQRLVRAIRRVNNSSEAKALALSRLPEPVAVNLGLSEAEALFGQFELICCDCIAVFIRTEVLLAPGQADYLDSLYRKVLQSPEFRPTRIEVCAVPATEGGERFADQFLGGLRPEEERPVHEFSLWVPYKKARLMKHWATRVGAEVHCDSVPEPTDDRESL